MEQWFTLKGKLVYEPVRPDNFKKTYKKQTLVAELRRDSMDLYYQWFLRKQHGSWIDLQRPMYGLHVTVVKGTEPLPNPSAWKKHAGKLVNFEVSPLVERAGIYWHLPVRCELFNQIRSELGLLTDYPYHITIGRQHEWQPK